jgi:hypothetical protein
LGQIRDIWLCLGVFCLKSQIPSTKFQGNSKLQAPHQKDGGQANLKEIPKFVILNFGSACGGLFVCYLTFVIWNLIYCI